MLKIFYLVFLISYLNFGQAIILIESPNQTSGEQDLIVNVRILDVVDLFGYSISINFNSDVISYISASKGDFLQNSSFFVTPPSISNPNILKIDHVVLGGAGYSGSGILFKVVFRANNSGSSILNLINVELRKYNNLGSIPFDISNGSVIVPLLLDSKIFLEGPFNSAISQMNTLLSANNWLPKLQPFNVPPYNYTGTEKVADSFFLNHQNIVDWILVELRNSINPQIISKVKAGFLLKNGFIVDMDGQSKIKFLLNKGEYFIKIYSRGHLPVVSKLPVLLNKSATLYDFTLNQNQAKGIRPQKLLKDNIYGLYAGDLTNDNQVTSSDFNEYIRLKIESSGHYNLADINYDGIVNGNDFQLFNDNYINIIGETITY